MAATLAVAPPPRASPAAVSANATRRRRRYGEAIALAEKSHWLKEPEDALRIIDDTRRQQAVQVLGASRDSDIARRVAVLLGDGTAASRKSAAQALGLMGAAVGGPFAIDVLIKGIGGMMEEAALEALLVMGDAVLPNLVALLRGSAEGPRDAAARALTAALRDEDGFRRTRTSEYLASHGGPAAKELAMDLLNARDLRTQRYAASILCGLESTMVDASLASASEDHAAAAEVEASEEDEVSRACHGSGFGGFISTDLGTYSLQDGEGGHLKGNYTFNANTGAVIDSVDGEVGTFSCDPISSSGPLPLGLDSSADEALPCIAVADSEIMAEIQNEENEGAFFVLPSQLNGAEYPSHDAVVHEIEEYKYDNTGGPRGQLAVHPAVGQFILDNAARDGRQDGISALDELLQRTEAEGLGFQLVNGYLRMPEPASMPEAEHAFEVFATYLHTLRSLTMSGVPASGLTPSKRRFSRATHRVSLVYASAVPVQAYLNNVRGPEAKELHRRVAEAVLVAQYYGALRVAARVASQPRGERGKIFLMPLGGGVFNNPWDSIARAMAVAVEMLPADARARLDIRALTWSGDPDESTTLRNLLAKHNKLRTCEWPSPSPEAAEETLAPGHLPVSDNAPGRAASHDTVCAAAPWREAPATVVPAAGAEVVADGAEQCRLSASAARAQRQKAFGLQPRGVEEATVLLEHSDAEVRAAAASFLVALGGAGLSLEHANALVSSTLQRNDVGAARRPEEFEENQPGSHTALEQSTLANRKASDAAGAALGSSGRAGASALHRHLLTVDDPAAGAECAELFRRIGPEAHDHLVSLLADRFGHAPTVAAHSAAQALEPGDAFDAAAMECVASLVRDDSDAMVRDAAADALRWAGAFGVPSAQRLWAELGRPSAGRETEVPQHCDTIEQSSELLDATVVLDRQDSHGDDRCQDGHGAVSTLCTPAASTRPTARSNAVKALGAAAETCVAETQTKHGNSEKFSGEIVVRTRDGDADVRRKAAEALGSLGGGHHPRLGADALATLLRDHDAQVRASAAVALAQVKIEGARHASAVAKLLRDREALVRSAAVDALGRLCDPAAMAQTITFLDDISPEVRISAALALGAMGTLGAGGAPFVARLLADGSTAVRETAVDVLARMGGAGAPEVAALLEHPEATVRQASVRTLSVLCGAGMPEVAARLTHHEAAVRCAALQALGSVGEKSSGHVAAIAAALGCTGAPKPRQDRWMVRLEATRALARLGSAAMPFVPRLVPLLFDREARVRAEAATSVSRLVTLGREHRCSDE